MQSPLAPRAVSGFSCCNVTEKALRTWGIVSEDERGPAVPVGAFKNRARVGGSKVPIEEWYLHVDLLRKGDEVANLVDSSATGKWVERPPLTPGNAESSRTRDLRVSMSASRHLKATAIAWLGGGRSGTLADRNDVRCISLTVS